MKTPAIDVFGVSVQKHINQVGFKNKFLRLWGNDGTVLTEKHYYYPSISAADVELFKLLGIYKSLKASTGNMSGIESAWVYLNPAKADISDVSRAVLIQQLEFNVPDGIYGITITPKAKLVRTGNQTIWTGSTSVAQADDTLGLLSDIYLDEDGMIDVGILGTYITNNYAEIINEYILTGNESPVTDEIDAEVANIVAVYALGGTDAFSADVHSISYTLTENSKTVRTDTGNTTEEGEPIYEYTSYPYRTQALNIQLNIKQIGVVGEDDPIIDRIMDAKASPTSTTASTIVNTLTSTSIALSGILSKTGVTDDVWLNSRMRAGIFSATTLKTKDLIPIITDSLDTGYKKKKVKWYKKIIGIIVFIVVFYFSGGTAAASLGAFSSAFTIATLAVVALSAAMAAWGDETGAAAVGKFSQKISVVGSLIGFMAIISSIATQISTEVAKQAAAEGTKQVATRHVLGAIKDMVVSVFKKYTTTSISLEQAVSTISRGFKMISDNKLDSLKDKLATVEAENAAASQYEEESNSRDIGLALIKSQAEVLHQDSDDVYDYQYEPWGSPLHIGNIQRTSWKWERTGAKDGLSNFKL